MGDAGDGHYFVVVLDDVNDAVVADADAPEIFVAAQFPATGRPWVVGQAFDLDGISSHADARV